MTLELNQTMELMIISEGKKMRLDKVLHQISGTSRKRINELIKTSISVNQVKVDSKMKPKHGDIIKIENV